MPTDQYRPAHGERRVMLQENAGSGIRFIARLMTPPSRFAMKARAMLSTRACG
jgi:hypothetical protein